MSLTFKVLDGTVKSTDNLCLSCSHMSRRKGHNNEDEIVCGSFKFESSNIGSPNIVPFRVSECTEYRPFNQQGLKDMYDIAWIVQARKKGPAGFDPTQAADKDGQPVITKETTEIEIVPPAKKRKDDCGDDDD